MTLQRTELIDEVLEAVYRAGCAASLIFHRRPAHLFALGLSKV
jgi:hypothetical protein